MRTIKFRGFHPDESGKTIIKLNGKEIRGEWHKGDLSTGGGYYIKEHSVIPETIGQYINKKDKNHKELFEGDIIKGCFCGEKFVIRYNEVLAKFNIGRKSFYVDFVRSENYKKVGNIFESPELLEVAE